MKWDHSPSNMLMDLFEVSHPVCVSVEEHPFRKAGHSSSSSEPRTEGCSIESFAKRSPIRTGRIVLHLENSSSSKRCARKPSNALLATLTTS